MNDSAWLEEAMSDSTGMATSKVQVCTDVLILSRSQAQFVVAKKVSLDLPRIMAHL